MPNEGSAHFFKLEEDITCSICLQELSDPVSITCRHNFCKTCISSYWATPQPQRHRSPECRKVCPRDQLIPAYRLQHLVSKVQLVVKEEQSKMTPARPIQLVYTDATCKMWLDESAVDRCFLDSEISDYPLCLICVIGEKRGGKSSLLNYILRALHRLEKGQPVSLGEEDEALKGFDWRSGTDSVTKGIWVWSSPFILKRNGEKMAVFVLDTEGSLDIESDRETCIKLSTLSMLLSSYLIFNVSGSLKTTELDYLEMYLHVSELTKESFSLQYLQHLNILVRDWQGDDNCGREAAKSYIEHETEKLRKSLKNYCVLETLRSPSVSSFLLPHPGKTFQRSSQGRLSDMDDDFRGHLTTYVSDLVEGLWLHRKTDVRSERITCGHLGGMLKDFVRILQREHFSCASPVEMYYSLENHKNIKNTVKKFKDFVEIVAPINSSTFKILGVRTSKMSEKVNAEASRLLDEYEQSLKGTDVAARTDFKKEMKVVLDQEVKKFCDEYSERFTKCAVGIGCAVGGGVLGVAGGIAGAAVVGTVLAVEAAAVLGSTTVAMVTGAVGGSVTLGAVGTGVGAGVGKVIGLSEENKSQKTEDTGNDDAATSEDTQELVPKPTL
ncbi:RING finger protein 112-like isoform X2 [Bufo bufo]|nr:RING finger protein 112-like isoform X2 [Bufo bufo]XP_040295747.1 RING finger protein 112-like isoform X2 [Bufo bufo]XP_040295748.1 RING finger protein 112-like isoform X2 [Bufo bufo]XP_040295749.1 RING finger protein 112-like isoform X2 [Bufo bufo]